MKKILVEILPSTSYLKIRSKDIRLNKSILERASVKPSGSKIFTNYASTTKKNKPTAKGNDSVGKTIKR